MSLARLGDGARRPRIAALTALLLTLPLAALLTTTPAHAAGTGVVTIDLLSTNDFHGRINANTVKWAWKIENLRQTTAANGHLLVGAGDNIGASEFASSVQDDQPTLDVLREIGLNASSVGNHEFDKGWADLKNRVIGGDPNHPTNIPWKYLGANVYAKGTTTPVLPEYDMFTESNGTGGSVSVAVIGAVTQETTSLVSPAGIADLTFGNAADAINRVARRLSNGDPADGEADVIVAAVHAGAVDGTKSFADEYANGGEFQQLANLDSSVNAVFEGHTHQAYSYAAPVTGGDVATRPLLQTGSYGSNIGQVVMTVDAASGHVTGYTAGVRPVPTTGTNASYVAQYPSVLTPVQNTVDAALANAARVGNQPVGSVTGDITTAYSGGSYVNGRYAGGTRDDRGKESTLGDLVANALRDGIPADIGKADIGIVNPGGLRNELFYGGDTSQNALNTNGVVTYAEANSVLPFVNNIWIVKVTGAQLRRVLEEQWSVANAGEAQPSRPFLNLGLSDNVRVTLDPTKPLGQRVTSIRIGDKPVDPAAVYNVSTFSFLGTGGDYFHTFAGAPHQDTGLVDRDLWISYLKSHQGITPDYARQQVRASGLPLGKVKPGQQVSLALSNLDLTSLGSPANPVVNAYLNTPHGSRGVGAYKVVDDGVNGGSAIVSFTVPQSVTAPSTLSLVARPSGTLIGARPKSHAKVKYAKLTYGHRKVVPVTVTDPLGVTPTGTVTLRAHGKTLGTARVAPDGVARVRLTGLTIHPGTYTVTAHYSGDATHSKSSDRSKLRVKKSKVRLKVQKKPQAATVDRTRARLRIAFTGHRHTVRGMVSVRTGGHLYTVAIRKQVAVVRLRPYHSTGRQRIVVRYLGSTNDKPLRKVVHLRVHR